MGETIRALLHQGELENVPAYKLQRTFGFNETLVFALEGLGTCLFGAFMMIDHVVGMAVGLAVLTAAVVLLFFHLGHPKRAWRALASFGTSWISRGTIFILIFLAIALVYLGLNLTNGYAADAIVGLVLRCLLLLSGVMILLYPGFVLAYSPSIPFWHSNIIPLVFLLSSLTSGLAWFIVYQATFTTGTASVALAQTVLLGLLLTTVVTHISLMRKATSAAAESARYLLEGKWRLQFGVFSVAVGTALPLVLMLVLVASGSGGVVLALTAALCKTVGDIYLRYSLVKVGMYDPVL